MNPLYESLPECVEVGGSSYRVVTDFRDWIRLADMLNDVELTPEEKVAGCLLYYLDEPPRDPAAAIRALVSFYCCGEPPERTGAGEGGVTAPVLSYQYDGGYILAAFRQVYRINLRAVDMHWWEFRWLFDALPKDCAIKERMAYRAVNLAEIKDAKERARIRRIQTAIAIPGAAVEDTDIGALFGGAMG